MRFLKIKFIFLAIFLVTNVFAEKLSLVKSYQKFALEYFLKKHIQNAIMFLCWTKNDLIDMMLIFSKHNIILSLPDCDKQQNVSDHSFSNYKDRIGGVFDFCHFDKIAPLVQRYSYFNSSYTWIVFDCETFNRSLEYLKTMPLAINTDLILTNMTLNSSRIDFFDVYHTGFNRGGKFKVVKAGEWFPEEKQHSPKNFTAFFLKSPVRRRYNLQGMTMKTITLTENNIENLDTHTYLMDDINPHVDTIFKMNYQLVRMLQNVFNFSIEFVLANNWSDKTPEGLYQAGNLMGLIGDKKGDIMAAALQLMVDRVEIADVLYMTYPFRCGFIFRYLGEFGDTQAVFYAPFAKQVWFCFMMTIVIVIMSGWIILSFENKYSKNDDKSTWSLSDTILTVIGACCQMGSELTPVTSASRTVYFIFFFVSLVIYNFYTSSIVSSLLNFKSRTFDITDLANSPLTCGSVDVGYVHNLLFDTPIFPQFSYFASKKKTRNFYYTIEEGVKRVKQGGFAYNAEFNSMYRLIEKTFEATEICELQEIDTISSRKVGILGQKHSQYSEMFKVGLNKAAETGQLKRLLLKWVSRKPQCQSNKSFKEVGLHQIASSHIILYAGIGFSLLLLIVERRKYKGYLTKALFDKMKDMYRRGFRNGIKRNI